MSRTVTITVDLGDGLIIGATLQLLARVNGAKDPMVGERMNRVGAQLKSAALLELGRAARENQ